MWRRFAIKGIRRYISPTLLRMVSVDRMSGRGQTFFQSRRRITSFFTVKAEGNSLFDSLLAPIPFAPAPRCPTPTHYSRRMWASLALHTDDRTAHRVVFLILRLPHGGPL